MPYLNVSWWNVNSPTVKQLLSQGGAERFAALDAAGRPKLEDYKLFTGYIVSPYTQIVSRVSSARWSPRSSPRFTLFGIFSL